METPILDLTFLHDVADNDSNYIYDVMNLFLNIVPSELSKLEKSVRESNDFQLIQRQAHALKSSAGIVKIRGMFDNLTDIESLAIQQAGKKEMLVKLDNMLANFNDALPFILAEKDKNKPVIK